MRSRNRASPRRHAERALQVRAACCSSDRPIASRAASRDPWCAPRLIPIALRNTRAASPSSGETAVLSQVLKPCSYDLPAYGEGATIRVSSTNHLSMGSPLRSSTAGARFDVGHREPPCRTACASPRSQRSAIASPAISNVCVQNDFIWPCFAMSAAHGKSGMPPQNGPFCTCEIARDPWLSQSLR